MSSLLLAKNAELFSEGSIAVTVLDEIFQYFTLTDLLCVDT
jgi:hypothetical protein